MKDIVPFKHALAGTGQLNSLPNDDAALTAMRTYLRIRGSDLPGSYGHNARHAEEARTLRNQRLPTWGAVNDAEIVFNCALDRRNVDKQAAVQIFAALHHAFNTKPSDAQGLIDGAMIALFDAPQHDDWIMICPTPEIIKAAARKIIRNQIHSPKGAEIFKECCVQTQEFRKARKYANEWLTDFQRADAVLLAFAPNDWERPYRLPLYQPLLREILQRHECAQMDDKIYAGEFQRSVTEAKKRWLIRFDYDDDDGPST